MAEDESAVTDLFEEQNQFTRKQSEDYNREMINEIRDRVAECQFIENRQNDDIQFDSVEGDWKTLCQVSAQPVAKDDIIFETLQDSKLAENHIIICGMVENIRNFVMPLRAKHLKTTSPIVILHEQALTVK